MPKIADLEYTPNPNARKFVLKEPLTNGLARSFENAEQAQRDELAAKLFGIAHVTNVFYIDNWITVTQDGEADWQNLLRVRSSVLILSFTRSMQSMKSKNFQCFVFQKKFFHP